MLTANFEKLSGFFLKNSIFRKSARKKNSEKCSIDKPEIRIQGRCRHGIITLLGFAQNQGPTPYSPDQKSGPGVIHTYWKNS